MKETKKEFEKCWDCDGTGKLPLGTKKWEDARTDFETKIREEEERKAYQITAKN